MAKIRRSRQVLAAILAVLSLCVSSAAACACAHHHPENGKVNSEQSSCHGQAHQDDTSPQAAPADAETRNGIDTSCECFMQAGPRVSIKNENPKVGKPVIAQAVTDPETILVQAGPAYVSSGFYSPEIFVSDPHYNLTPGRAPPRP
jgi:hypothetical protein